METSSDYRVSSTPQLRSIIGDPGELAPKKVMGALDEMATDFIRRSPFLVLATTDAEGNLDASPKGGGPGFVAVEDELTLAIPDRKGNKLIFGLQNILANPHVGLIFVIPGTDESWGKYFASKIGLSQDAAAKLDEMVEHDYKHNL